jgi:hypothetical protein
MQLVQKQSLRSLRRMKNFRHVQELTFVLNLQIQWQKQHVDVFMETNITGTFSRAPMKIMRTYIISNANLTYSIIMAVVLRVYCHMVVLFFAIMAFT